MRLTSEVILSLLLLPACRSGGGGKPAGEAEQEDSIRTEAPVSDAGFGSAVAVDAQGDIWIGAPFGPSGTLWWMTEAALTEALDGTGKLGFAVAVDMAGVLVTAPLDGEGRLLRGDTGDTLASGSAGARLGAALAGGSSWATSTATGWVTESGASAVAPSRPSSLAWGDGEVAIGMVRGPIAAQLGSAELSRPQEGDEGGASIAAGDFDGDGLLDWAVGAPGADCVYFWSPGEGRIQATLSIPGGRLGASLAAGDIDGDSQDDLAIGAPASSDWDGAVYLFANGDLESPIRQWSGQTGDELGASVSIGAGVLVMGAPGRAGSVLVFRP